MKKGTLKFLMVSATFPASPTRVLPHRSPNPYKIDLLVGFGVRAKTLVGVRISAPIPTNTPLDQGGCIRSHMDFTPKQLQAFAETLILIMGRRKSALILQKKDPFYSELIPLTKLYSRWNAKCRLPIRCAVDVCFKRTSRGNNIDATRSISRWTPRKDGENNMTPRMKRTLKQIYEANKDHISSVRHFVYSKEDTSLVVTSEFQFPSKEIKLVFQDQVIADLGLTPEDAEFKNK
jgi:hypothetical protein